MLSRLILSDDRLALTLKRLTHELIEKHGDFENSCLLGVQPRGVFIGNRIFTLLKQSIDKPEVIRYGILDPTFHRDDFRHQSKILLPNATQIRFSIEGLRVVLMDDVLFTGRTIRASLDAMLSFGRPKCVELLVLVDRRWKREFPIQPDYCGIAIDTLASEKVVVKWAEQDQEDLVIIQS